MFKTNPDAMRMEATPERVYAVCRLVAHKPCSKEDIVSYISLDEMASDATGDINRALGVASAELGLLVNKDGKYSLQVATSVLDSTTSFRQYVANKVFANPDSTFTQFSRWYVSRNETIFALSSWEDKAVAAKISSNELSSINENAVLGWRFWASFLGLGYLSGTMLLPNMKLRIQDALANNWEIYHPYNEAVTAQKFLQWTKRVFPEVTVEDLSPLPLGYSAGLRTLHELGLIELQAQRDTERVKLYPVDADPLNDFSHVIVKEAVKQ